jgi:hypothetical protein
MTSMQNKKMSFSMDDFEKGLMLAGIITPNTNQEMHEREKLEEYEEMLRQENKHTYFKRIVLAAKIASELYGQPTFGRIKFQKLMYLCEHAANLKLEQRYSKQVAGPFDNKFMHTIELEFKTHEWFEVVKVNDGYMKRSKYVPLHKMDEYRKYYYSYFPNCLDSINYVIDLFKTLNTDTTEIAATLVACHLEILHKDEQFSEPKLLELFFSWSKEKERFKHDLVRSVWIWLNEKNLVKH